MYSAKSVRNWLFALPLALPLGAALALPVLAPGEALAAFCSNDSARFNEWKQAVKAEYRGKFKPSTLAKIDGLKYSSSVIKLDRNQKSFKMSFDQFYKRRATGVASGARKRIKKYRKYFDRAEQKFGVPPEIIAAIWGLESAFGTYKGKTFPILQSIATLSYDCRRTDLFSREFRAALEVIDRGYYDLSRAKGAWAGEIGQTQFLPSSFLLGATDFDGGGIDVFRSPADVIGSTAKWFARNGWQRGGSYQPGSANFGVIQRWNKAGVYQKTIAKLAAEIRG
ncbi:lytic murein transglycosylase [Salaquimonas pukyongi]|uniref:lytic murein transglycosylase n=1 Tax=Salaquimonas pukyongi TaxID=2712698 RepID=UPI0012EBD4B4|nr:lytic murein transglycosylase [Salaquimonas pukyongi]